MTGISSSSSPTGFGLAALVAGVLVAAAPAVLVASDRRYDRCGPEQVACATPVLASARQTDKDDRDKDKGKDRDRRDGDGRRGRTSGYELGWGYGRGGHSDMRAPRPHEWDETQTFMRVCASRRLTAIDQLPDGEAKESMKKYWFARYRGIQSLQKRDPMGHDQRLAQLRIEDQIFGIISDWAGPDQDPDRQQLRDTLRTQVNQLVDLDLLERQRKVDALKRELAEQSELLKNDQAQRDALVEKRVSRFSEWAARWASRRKQYEAEKGTEKHEGDERREAGDDPAEQRDKRD